MSKKNSGADEPQTVLTQDAETNASQEPKADEPKADEPKADEQKADEQKADEPKADEPKADEPKADEPKADETKADETKADETKADGDHGGEANEMDEHEAEAQDIMRKHDKKELWRSGDGYWFSVKDLAEFHAKTKQTILNYYTHAS